MAHSYPICSQLKVPQINQSIKPFDLLYSILHQVEVLQLFQMTQIPYVFDSVETKI